MLYHYADEVPCNDIEYSAILVILNRIIRFLIAYYKYYFLTKRFECYSIIQDSSSGSYTFLKLKSLICDSNLQADNNA